MANPFDDENLFEINSEHITRRRTISEKVTIELDDDTIETLIRESLVRRKIISKDINIEINWDISSSGNMRGVTIKFNNTSEEVL